MSSTPKTVRRNGGNCICAERLPGDAGTCKWGYCVVFRCPKCRGELASWGPVACPGHGHPRWCRYPEMEPPGRWDLEKDVFVKCQAALKPSIRRRRSS